MLSGDPKQRSATKFSTTTLRIRDVSPLPYANVRLRAFNLYPNFSSKVQKLIKDPKFPQQNIPA